MLPTRLLYLLQRLAPGSCHLCGCGVSRPIDICGPCQQELPSTGPACSRCGIPLEHSNGNATLCGRCQVKPLRIDRIDAAFPFRYPIDLLVRRFKFDRDLVVGQLLGNLLAAHIDALLASGRVLRPDVILPVPLHPGRERERGFNQSTVLADSLAAHLGIPVHGRLLLRHRDTPVQSGLDARQRRRNIRNAFGLSGTPVIGHVALVDDVATTGSTLDELAGLLKRAGVERVDAWVVARTPRH